MLNIGDLMKVMKKGEKRKHDAEHYYTIIHIPFIFTMASIQQRGLSQDAQDIIRNVYVFCKEEKEAGIKISLKRALDRCCEMTGVANSTVLKYCSPTFKSQTWNVNNRTKKRKVHTLVGYDKGVLKRSISTMYGHQNLLPTLDNIRRTLEENIDYRGSKSHLRKELKEMGFES